MKYWLSHLPLEVWVDVFRYPWISREELGNYVDRFSNHKFAEYLQFYLHDWGRRKLNPLSFELSGLYKIFDHYPCHRYVDYYYPLTTMPENIKSFERIEISTFYPDTINFMRKIQSILTDVNIKLSNIFSYNLKDLHVILANLAPFLNGVHSLYCCDWCALPTVRQCFGNKLLAKLNELEINDYGYYGSKKDAALQQTAVSFLTDWLALRDGNGLTKVCRARIYNDTAFGSRICLAIREQFFAATHPSTFVLNLRLYPEQEFAAEFHLQNGIGEELHGVRIADKHFQITRHRENCGKELQEWSEENEANKNCFGGTNEIVIQSPAIIRSIDAAMDAPGNVEEDEDDRQPTTSKKARIS